MAGKCIIIGAGDLTIGKFDVGEEDFVIAADGGLAYCGLLEIEPDLILGDFDSVGEAEQQAISILEKEIPDRIIRLKPEKDDTDMMAAIRIGLDKGYRDFRILAGTGGRFDHTLANIQTLLFLKRHDACGYLIDGSGMMLVIENEEVRFQKNLEGYLSCFSLCEKSEGVTMKGLKFTLQDATITNDYPIGISNEFIDEEAVISVEQGQLLLILQYVTD